MTEIELFDCLSYAAIAQQVEVTEMTTAVYFDQLGRRDYEALKKAVREWVSTYSDPYRRLPTVGEIKAIMDRGRARIDPEVSRVMRINSIVAEARKRGESQEEIDRLIEWDANGLVSSSTEPKSLTKH